MKNNKVREILIPALSLFLICVVVTALLGFTNKVTEPKIDELALKKATETKAEVLSEADAFSDEMTANYEGKDYSYYEGTKGGEKVGYVFATSAKGYGGDIDIMVGINTEGKVTGVSILEINETAGLGMHAKDEDFRNQFKDKSSQLSVVKNTTPGDTEILALTGATISSRAMTNAVNIALNLYKQVGGENNG